MVPPEGAGHRGRFMHAISNHRNTYGPGGYTVSVEAYGIREYADDLRSNLTAVGAVIFLMFTKESHPRHRVLPDMMKRIKVFAGLKHIFKQRDMIILLVGFFLALVSSMPLRHGLNRL